MPTRNTLFKTSLLLAVCALLALPAGASVIYSGSDLWRTPGDGGTYTDFGRDPIPADFFCPGSEPFAGRIEFRGAPLATSPPGALGTTDTVVQRLDDAAFDRNGVARTRIRVTALAFESLAPVETSCGAFDVAVGLEGRQPETQMSIVRDKERGGYFLAPISVNVKLSFLPADGGKGRLELVRQLDFAPNRSAFWAEPEVSAGLSQGGFVLVDTDGDRKPDTFLPGTSNFSAGWAAPVTAGATETEPVPEPTPVPIPHCGNPPLCTHNHTTEPVPEPTPSPTPVPSPNEPAI